MSEWLPRSLADLARLQKGRKVNTSPSNRNGLVPYLGASALEGGPTQYADPNNAVSATRNDVLMLWDGERSGLVGRGQDGVVGSTVMKLTPRGRTDAAFLFHALNRKFAWIQGRRTGTGIPHVPRDLATYLQLPVPSRPEEEAIVAHILDALDEAIQTTEKVIVKLEQLKQGLVHDLLTLGIDENGMLRDAVRHPEQFYKSSLGRIPKLWEVHRVSDVCHLGRGRVISQEYLVAHAGPYPVYSSQSREGGVFGWIDTYDFEGPHVTWTTDGAYAGTVFFRTGRFNCTNVCGTLDRRTDQLDMEYLALALQPRTQRHVSYVGNPKLMNNIVATIPLPLPPSLEQKGIAAIARAASHQVEQELRSASKLRRIKDGLMEDLLTGHVRVSPFGEGFTA